MMHLEALNAAGREDFIEALGDIFEDAPWVAEQAFARRPFPTVAALHEAMAAAASEASPETRLALLRGHPELGGKVARAGAMAPASRQEQGGLGLDRLGDAEFARFGAMNAAYRERFDFPFIICVRRHTRDSFLPNSSAASGITATPRWQPPCVRSASSPVCDWLSGSRDQARRRRMGGFRRMCWTSPPDGLRPGSLSCLRK